MWSAIRRHTSIDVNRHKSSNSDVYVNGDNDFHELVFVKYCGATNY